MHRQIGFPATQPHDQMPGATQFGLERTALLAEPGFKLRLNMDSSQFGALCDQQG
jgi:hypothetical protein